jgi:Fe-S cluster biogenesis protein NfuA
MTEEQLSRMVSSYIEKLRPYIQADGGDIELVRIEDGIVYVRFHGACIGCTQIDRTLRDGLETLLVENIPQIIGVELVENAD